MELGVPLYITNRQIFIKAGYKQVPNHSFANHKYEEQWISRIDKLGKPKFPRFHIIKEKGWYIHYDYFETEEAHKTKTNKCPQILREIRRLNKIAEQYAISKTKSTA